MSLFYQLTFGGCEKMTDYEIERTVTYDPSTWSTVKYYLKRFSKHTISLILTAVIMYLLNDVRYLAIVPVLEIAQKLLKEKNLWY